MVKRVRSQNTSAEDLIVIKKRRLELPRIRFMKGLEPDMIEPLRALLAVCSYYRDEASLENQLVELRDPHHLIVCAYDVQDPDKLVGVLIYKTLRPRDSTGTYIMIVNSITSLCVSPAVVKDAGKNHEYYAEYLLNFIISYEYIHMREQFIGPRTAIVAHVPKNHASILRLFQRLGFTIERRTPTENVLLYDVHFNTFLFIPIKGDDFLASSSLGDGKHTLKASELTNDCALRTMRILGAILPGDAFQSQLRQYLRRRPREGTPPLYILNILSFRFGTLVSFRISDSRDEVKRFLKDIPPTSILPFGYTWRDAVTQKPTGHITVIGRLPDQRLFCYEDQSGVLYLGDTVVTRYLLHKQIYEWLFYITTSDRSFAGFDLEAPINAQLGLKPFAAYQVRRPEPKPKPASQKKRTTAPVRDHDIDQVVQRLRRLRLSSSGEPMSISTDKTSSSSSDSLKQIEKRVLIRSSPAITVQTSAPGHPPLLRSFFSELEALLPQCFETFGPPDIDFLKNPAKTLYWIRGDDGRIIAFGCFSRTGFLHNHQPISNIITYLCTDKRARRRGYMTELLTKILSDHNAHKPLYLEVLKSNATAIRLYKRHGFLRVDSYDNLHLMQLP